MKERKGEADSQTARERAREQEEEARASALDPGGRWRTYNARTLIREHVRRRPS